MILPRLHAFWRNLVSRARVERALDEELRSTYALLIDEQIRAGVTPTEARRLATLELGGIEPVKERVRDAHAGAWLDGLVKDLGYALRTCRRDPGFVALSIATLALGIGVNTAIFSVGDALLLRPLPYPDADRLVALRSIHSSSLAPDGGRTNLLDLADWQVHATSFEAIAGYRWRTVDLTGGAYSERLHGLYVTPDYFDVFGVTTVNGRTFALKDRGTHTIVLGRGVWERRFAADRALVGSRLDVNMINVSRVGPTPHLVLGTVPVDVHFPPLTADFNLGVTDVEDRIDFWLPEFVMSGTTRGGDRTLDVVAKLRPGVTLAHAQTEMDTIAHALADAFPTTNRDWGVQVVPLRSQIVGGARRVILLLSLATLLVLVIACGNVSTVFLARGLARQPEIAVRLALGASRLRIARQFLIESLLIALVAAALGVGLTFLGIRLQAPWFPADVPLMHGAGIDASVLAFAVPMAGLTACLSGIVPAWISSGRRASATGLNARGQGAQAWQHRAVSALVATQVALTLVLVVSTGLLLRSAARVWDVEPGFDAHNVLTMTISLPHNKFDWQHNVVFSREVVNAVKTEPLVKDAAVIQGVPMRAGGFWTTFSVDNMPTTATADLPVARMRVVSPGYFRVMKIPLFDGRDFDERDSVGERGHPTFVIVNRALAARYWPGESAVGKRIHAGPDNGVTVAGVVGDVRYAGLETPPDLEIYLPEGLFPQAAITLLVRTTTNPRHVMGTIRARIVQIDREVFVTDVKTMNDLIVESLASRRFATLLLMLCAGIGVLLVVSGIYGVVAQAVVQRRSEIGIRMALGATPTRVVRLMLRCAVSPVATGAVVGLLGTAATARLLSALLFDIHPFDPPTLAAATALFVVVALVAAWLPARRATKVGPLVALRCE